MKVEREEREGSEGQPKRGEEGRREWNGGSGH